jgi:hypothetical protein
VAFVVVLRAALSFAMERALPLLAERFGLEARVANVDLALLRGQLAIEGLHVAAPSEAEAEGEAAAPPPDLLALARGFVDVEWTSLLRGELDIAALELDAPTVALLRAPDGYLELPPLPPRAGAPAPAEEPAEPLPVRLRSITIRDSAFRLLDGAGGPDLVDFALDELGLSEVRLAEGGLGLGGIRLGEPRLRVRRELRGTKLGARAPAPRPEAPGEALAETEAAAGPALRIDDLRIERAELSLATAGEPLVVALELSTSGVSLAPGARFPVRSGLDSGAGRIVLEGELGLSPPAWDGRLEWSELALPALLGAALPALSPWLASGTASGGLALRVAEGELAASGALRFEALDLGDPEQELALKWKSLEVEVKEAHVPFLDAKAPVRVALGKVSLSSPRARYTSPTTAFTRLAAALGAEPGVPDAEEGEEDAARPPPQITVEALGLSRGRVDFRDLAEEPPYEGSLRDLRVDAAGVALPARSVRSLRMRGIAPGRAPFTLVAALPARTGTLDFEIEKLPLAQFASYLERSADVAIRRGELSLETRAALADGGASGKVTNDVRLHDLALGRGERAISVAGMPLDLALGLLRDPKGDIRLPVPLEYGSAGASAGFASILVGALRAAITGAVSTPIKALGAVIPKGGAKGDELALAEIEFAPGSAAVSEPAAEQLAALARLLGERPRLALTLAGEAGPEDRLALAEQILIERAADGGALPDLAGAGFFERRRVTAALAERARGEAAPLAPEDEALLARYREATAVPAARYEALALRRAEALRERFASEHDLAGERIDAEVGAASGAARVVPELRLREEEPPAG